MIREVQMGGLTCHVLNWIEGYHPREWMDFDDVIRDTGMSKELACRELLRREIPARLLDSAKLEQAGLTEDEYKLIQYAVYKGSNSNVLVPMPGAVEGLSFLISKGRIPGIVTALFDEAELGLVQCFLEEDGLGIIPIVGVGYQASKEGAKAHVLEAVGAHIYIDDDIKMINAILAAGKPSYKLCLFDPKRRETAPQGVKLLDSWDGIVEEFFLPN